MKKKNGKCNSVKTLVLGFINYRKNINLASNSYFLSEFSSKDNMFIKKVNDFMDIIVINLQEISQKLENDEKIYILGKEIGDTGKNWLKLLSLRYWGIKDDKKYFKIPKINIDKEIDSAIEYLSKVSIKSLTFDYEAENEYSISVEEAANEKAKHIIEQKNAEIAEKVAKKNEEVAKKYEEIAKKNEEISKKNEEISKKNEEISKKNEEISKKNEIIAKKGDEQLKTFLVMLKHMPNFNLDELEKELNINFSEIDINKVMSLWGNKDKEKLEIIKEYLGKKRRNFDGK